MNKKAGHCIWLTIGLIGVASHGIANGIDSDMQCGMQQSFLQDDTEVVDGRVRAFTRPVLSGYDSLAFYDSTKVNTDGAAQSYAAVHKFPANDELPVRLNTVCNGVQLRNRAKKIIADGKSDASCQRVLNAVRTAGATEWKYAGADVVIEWVGIEAYTDKKTHASMPCINGNYFVSKTEIAARPAMKDGEEFKACDQSRWIDAMTVPAVVIPMNGEFRRLKVSAGDRAVVYLPGNGDRAPHTVFAIVGDAGPATSLGEGTPALLSRLRLIPPLLPTSEKPSSVTAKYGLEERSLTVVFPESDDPTRIYDDPVRNEARARAVFIDRFGSGDETVALNRLAACARRLARIPQKDP